MLDEKEWYGWAQPGGHARDETAELPSAPSYGTCKATIDSALAAALLVLTAPFFLVLFALVKLTSRGPFIYSQKRLGLNNRPFTIYKVRTMAHDCERQSGARWSTRDDPRVTPIGRYLRRAHLDELPQLWNVLRGEMSLVGPRPERPEFVCQLEKTLPRYSERHLVRPGLTGLAQVHLPPDTDFESVRLKLALDLQYVERFSIGLDLRILLCTALFLTGIPFPVSCRVLRLQAEADGLDRDGLRPAEDVKIVSQPQPAWHDR